MSDWRIGKQNETRKMPSTRGSSCKNELANEVVHCVMHEFKNGTLYSRSGAKVTNRKQAIAIALSMARRRAGVKRGAALPRHRGAHRSWSVEKRKSARKSASKKSSKSAKKRY